MPKSSGRPPVAPASRFWSKVDKTDTCWLWTAGLDISGYGRFFDGTKESKAHRWAFQDDAGPIPSGAIVLHSCDERMCVNPAHLRLGTHDDNMADMRARGRQARGCRTNTAKLTADDVVVIRELFAAGGVSQAALARKYGVTSGLVSTIVRGETWSHIGGPRTQVGRGKGSRSSG
jgi:hypothetical protein